MKLSTCLVTGLTTLASFAFVSPVHANTKDLLEALVANNAITQAQADEILKKSPTFARANRGTVTDLRIRGRIQGQFALADGSNSNTVTDADSYSSFELRRARLGVQGTVLDDWKFLVEANVLSTTDLDSATLTWAAHKEANITFGKAKPQFGHEENTSSASILTMERSQLTGNFNGGKPLGLRVHGDLGMFNYYAGVYNGQSVSTGRMGFDQDSYLFNGSIGLNLDELVGSRLRLRLDYLGAEKDSGYYTFDDAMALSVHYAIDQFDIRAEYMTGEDFNGDKTRGFYIMPSYYIIPKQLQAVLRYEQIRGDDGVSLGQNRYADRTGAFAAGNRYKAIYVGANYYISGDNLKLMGGLEFAENKDTSTDEKGKATTFITGVRMQF